MPENRELVDLLVAAAPVQKGEAAAPLLRKIERMAQNWVEEEAGLSRMEHRPVRLVA